MLAMTPETILDGLAFPEGPRWHDGKLYFSDQHDGIVWRLDSKGKATQLARVPAGPSGLGWLPDGTLCVVSMVDRRLLRITPQGTALAADLSSVIAHTANDMVIDSHGRVYIGNFGFDLNKGEDPRPTVLLCVRDGKAAAVADDVLFPNGMVITSDGKTLIVAETFAARLTAFTIQQDGGLTDRRVFADLNGNAPDGICLDEQMGVWIACPIGNEVIRVKEGGEVTDRIPLPGRHSYACMLGGHDRRDLYICTALDYHPEQTVKQRAGKIEMIRVEIAGAGLP
jgi:sugar lactone lactonase YvrE